MEKNNQFYNPFFVRDSRYLEKHLHANIKNYKQHEIVMPHHNENKPFAYVLTGLVYLCGENNELQKTIVGYYRPGEFLSTYMLTTISNSVSYIITKKASAIAFFDYEDLLNYVVSDKSFADRVFAHIFQTTEKRMVQHTYILQQRNIHGKLMSYFSMEKVIQGSKTLSLPLPYTDLADYLAVDRSALMRELKKMKADQLLSASLHQVILLSSLF